MTAYRFVTRPYRHQRAALKSLLRRGWGGALLMEPRTGKTKTTVDWLGCLVLQGKIDRALVVCPNRVMDVWVRELLRESPLRVHVTVWDKKERAKGPPASPPGYQLYVVITNYEAFATPGRQTPCRAQGCSGKRGECTHARRRSKASGRFRVRANLRKWMRGHTAACVLDESHKIKSASGSAATMLVSMRDDFPYRVILTGTPLTKAKRSYDIYMQWKFLNPDRFAEWPRVEDFKTQFGKWLKKDGYDQYLGPRNMSILHRRIAEDAYIVRRDQCFDLPPREDLVEFVDLRASRSVYEQMATDMVAMLEDGFTAEASLKIVQALRLSQITSGFVTDDSGEVRRLGFEKYDRAVEIVGDRLDMDQKIIVVARWKPDLDLLEGFGREMRVPTYSIRGKVKRADSDRYIREFAELDGAGLMVLQPDAAALGIDLSSASMMVWYSHTPSWVNFTQCCDRIALARSSTTFVHLVARRSVDEMLLSTLAGDGDVHRAIMTTPGELVNGHPLDLDDHSRLRGIGSFQYRGGKR